MFINYNFWGFQVQKGAFFHPDEMASKFEGEELFELASSLEYEKQRYKEAAFYYEKAIAKNHPLAQFNFALWYLEGSRPGVPKNLVKARKLFEASASQGVGAAMVNLAQMYEKGSGGLKKNETEAFKLYRKSVQDERKGFNVGRTYMHVSVVLEENFKMGVVRRCPIKVPLESERE